MGCMNNAFHFYSDLEWIVCSNQVVLKLSVSGVEHKIYCNFKNNFPTNSTR